MNYEKFLSPYGTHNFTMFPSHVEPMPSCPGKTPPGPHVDMLAGKLTIVAPYRPPKAASDDANTSIKVMELIREENSSYVIMGDFNLPDTNWIMLDWKELNNVHGKFLAYFVLEELSQIVSYPTKGDNILNEVLLTKSLQACSPLCVPPNAHSDHSGQLVDIAYM